jgi:hypothetical protein
MEEALEALNACRDELQAIDGLQAVHDCQVSDDQGMVISRWDSAAAAEAAQPQIQAILGRMASFMTSMPEVTTGEVVWEM